MTSYVVKYLKCVQMTYIYIIFFYFFNQMASLYRSNDWFIPYVTGVCKNTRVF